MEHLFYRLDQRSPLVVPAALPAPLRVELWRPSLLSWSPSSAMRASYVWSLFHAFRIFSNREYQVFLIKNGDTIIHRSYIFPRYFRFPFMRAHDLQVGDTWTDPAYRGRGLASFALQTIASSLRSKGADIWYLVEEENKASIAVVERCGFSLQGRGVRTKRFGLRLLGAYVLRETPGGAYNKHHNENSKQRTSL